jgi:DNA-binding Lrp family transcriptional regulator
MQISQRRLAEQVRCSPPTAAAALNELEDQGFLVRTSFGRMRGKVVDRAGVFRLTWHHDNEGGAPTRDYKRKA